MTLRGWKKARTARQHRRKTLNSYLILGTAALFAIVTCVSAGQPTALAATRTAKSKSSGSTPFKATGYFYVAKKKGRWTFVTPQGEPFYASGIDTVSPVGETDQETGLCLYCEAIQADYPNTAAWASATVSDLQDWGFNSLGSFSDYTDLGSQMPFEVSLSMASGDDWFAPSFVTNADEVAAEDVAPYANDPNVIGYFTDTELNWGPPDTPNNETLLQEYLNLPAGSPGLAVAQEYEGNPDGFLYALATRYFSVTTAAIRMYDTHHLILGCKLEGELVQPQVLEAARPYVDVDSVEDYVYNPGFDAAIVKAWPFYLPLEQNLANFYKYAKKPLLIGEYSFTADGPQDPNTVPGIYPPAPNQQVRASNFENFIAPIYEDSPWVVGDDWFQWYDEPAGGRVGDGENNDFGMVNVENQPYPTMVSAMELMHSMTSSRLAQTGPECDSWATSGSGVTCTDSMPAPTYPLTIVTDSLAQGELKEHYNAVIYSAGGQNPYAYSLVDGSLPPGLKLSGSGTISGTPKQAGTFSFTVQAADSAGSTQTQALSITIGNGPLKVTTHKINLTTNQTYSTTLGATGGIPPYTWTIFYGSVPPGMTLSSDGVLSGEPTAAGLYSVTVVVEDQSTPALETLQGITIKVKT